MSGLDAHGTQLVPFRHVLQWASTPERERERGNSREMTPFSPDKTGHESSILQRSPISLIWLQWETAWLAAALLLKAGAGWHLSCTSQLLATLYLVAFFLPWMATALPLRVLALFLVFWPRTGSLCKHPHLNSQLSTAQLEQLIALRCWQAHKAAQDCDAIMLGPSFDA